MSGYESLDRSAIAFAPSRELTAGGFLDYAAFCASLSRHRLSACARAPFKQSVVLNLPFHAIRFGRAALRAHATINGIEIELYTLKTRSFNPSGGSPEGAGIHISSIILSLKRRLLTATRFITRPRIH